MSTEPTEPADLAIVQEEEALYARVVKHLASQLITSDVPVQFEAELLSLRDQIAEARQEDVAPLVEHMYRTAALAGRRGQGVAPLPDINSPYFGHMVLEEDGTRREVLIGKRSHIDREAGVVIVDWRNAPISRLFYRYDEGDAYDEEINERLISGELLVRRTVSIVAGKLRRIDRPEGSYVRLADGSWYTLAGARSVLAGGQRTASRPSLASRQPRRPPVAGTTSSGHWLGLQEGELLRPDKHLPEIAALLDKAQFDLISRAHERTLVVAGGAGSGKTTVALHRIAFLHYQDPSRYRPKTMLVVVPQAGLVEYVSQVLPGLEVAGVEVRGVLEWQRRIRQRLLPRLRWKTTSEISSTVAAVKKHPGMLGLIARYVQEQARRIREQLRHGVAGLPGGDRVVQAFGEDPAIPLAERLGQARLAARRTGGEVRDAVTRLLALAERRCEDVVQDWAELLTSGEWLATGLLPAPTPEAVAETVRQVLRQLEDPAERMEVAGELRRGVDGHSEDEEQAHCFDPCDEALMLRLWQVKYGALATPGGRRIHYDHVAVDEAQDLSVVELRVLLDTTRDASMTLAGDMAQKVVFDTGVESWEQLLAGMGIAEAAVDTLGLAYRSTYQVMQVAHHVLGPLAPEKEPVCTRSGAPVQGFVFSDPGETVAFLAQALRSLMARERVANVAVLTRYAAQADMIYQGLAQAEVPRLRRVVEGAFTFTPGIDVTEVVNAKGLEYDYVLVVEADAASYPENRETRHLLHVAITRAVHQLWVTCSGPPSPLLPESIFA